VSNRRNAASASRSTSQVKIWPGCNAFADSICIASGIGTPRCLENVHSTIMIEVTRDFRGIILQEWWLVGCFAPGGGKELGYLLGIL
jgi:hypothetical protein